MRIRINDMDRASSLKAWCFTFFIVNNGLVFLYLFLSLMRTELPYITQSI